MIRRTLLFIAVVLGVLIAPFAQAQSASKTFHIGYLVARGPDPETDGAFLQELRDLGYVEGRNIVIERRYANGKVELLPGLAADLADMKLDLVVAAPVNAVLAMKKATSTLPIVMANSGDPVRVGLVASLARPGGNVTGLSNLAIDLVGKELELLKELSPGITRVAVLATASYPFVDAYLSESQAAAKTLGLQLQFVAIKDASELEWAIQTMARAHVGGFFVTADPVLFSQLNRIAKLATQYRLPAITPWREFAKYGGLVAYGPSLADNFRRSATYVDKILKGANPADLPIEQPTKFDFVINLRTAKALQLTIPPSVILRATEVIR